jgi:hypothetical protein
LLFTVDEVWLLSHSNQGTAYTTSGVLGRAELRIRMSFGGPSRVTEMGT